MEYINSEKASKRWNISQRRIIELAQKGRIKGAKKLGRAWLIPEDADKPIDGRTKLSKSNKIDNTFFRYPDYAFKDIPEYNPPLSREELILKKTMELFYTLDFKGANDTLGNLTEYAENKYCFIYALYVGCMIDIYLGDIKRFINRYQRLYIKISEEVTHKEELKYLIEEINATLGYDDYFKENFFLNLSLDYDSSFLSHLTMLASVSLFYHHDKSNIMDIKGIELTLKALENTHNITDKESTYMYIGNVYSLLNKEKEMRYYYKKAFDIAIEYDSYYPLVQQYYYLSNTFDEVLEEYPVEFKNKIIKLSNKIHKLYVRFTDDLSFNSFYKLLPSDYYPLLYYAVQGYSNKQIAKILHTSENYINKKYSQMYDIADVKNKNELISLYKKTMDISILTK